eukprot:TRINITY_DN2856_c0_g1_i1.p1 TRINITY_DN2856_c0_g1~~TRINITY_DN2856_c0_g1_i1.p1  ORF type:complete len:614 (-),score=139.62 TRINITY_DN2856_c0_g1_i1:132-1973(-)
MSRSANAPKVIAAKMVLPGLAPESKFVDAIFPADVSSLCFDPNSPKISPEAKDMISQVKSWRRPNEWSKNPVLFKDDASPGDIEQGQLGDCWLLSALAVVATKPQILKFLFVKADPLRGEYHLRFYREGKWEEVRIDDRIPCGSDGRPVFAHCQDPDEIWVPIIEKALAKMLGTYEALDGGFLEEGVVLLTGGRPQRVTVNDWKYKNGSQENADELWTKLNQYYKEGQMMGAAICSGKEIPDKSTGLISGHAYGVLSVRETNDKKYKLIQLRNPWGSFEWKGKWSDGSKEWNSTYIKEMGEVEKDDGAFWMSLEDFRRYYDKITVCRIFNLKLFSLPTAIGTPEEAQLKIGNYNWSTQKFDCEWNDMNAGGMVTDTSYSQNPHLILNVPERSRFFFLVSQPTLTTQSDSRYYRTAIGFSIHSGLVKSKGVVRIPGPSTTEDCFVQAPVRARYNSCDIHLDPGNYVIVPFTEFPNRKTKFTFEIYAHKKFACSVLEDDKESVKDAPVSTRPPASPKSVEAPQLERARPMKSPSPATSRSPRFEFGAGAAPERSVPPRAKSASKSPSSPSPSASPSPSPALERSAPPPKAPTPAPAKPAQKKKDDRFQTTSRLSY